jgi:hypothetical protein
MYKINYLIAASNHRKAGIDQHGIKNQDILKLHFKELLKTDTSKLTQVTLLKAGYNDVIDKKQYSSTYWKIKTLSRRLKCLYQELELPNEYFSYSSWIRACLKYQELFDYYILIEDDYYPVNNFVDELIRIHQQKLPNGGYLCSFASDHGAVSNGIVDGKTFYQAIMRYKNPIKELEKGAQRYFTYAFFPKNFADFADQYRCLFKSNELIDETHDISLKLKQDIFRPIQYLNIGEQVFKKSILTL